VPFRCARELPCALLVLPLRLKPPQTSLIHLVVALWGQRCYCSLLTVRDLVTEDWNLLDLVEVQVCVEVGPGSSLGDLVSWLTVGVADLQPGPGHVGVAKLWLIGLLLLLLVSLLPACIESSFLSFRQWHWSVLLDRVR